MNTAIATVNTGSLSLVVDNTKELTMSSRQIAEFTGKKHKHVLRDIRDMFESLGIPEESKIGFVEKINNLGFTVKEPIFNLNEELTITLVAGYNVVMRNTIVREWQRLKEENQKLKEEAQVNPYANMSKLDWMRKAVELEEEKEQLIGLHVRKSIDAHSMTRLLGEKKGSMKVQRALAALKAAGYIERRVDDSGKPNGYDLLPSAYGFSRMTAHGQLEFTVDVLPVLVELGVLEAEQKETLRLPQPSNARAIANKAAERIRSNSGSLSLVGFDI
ncbi:Rha family transcriptional regulator [Salmonella enterica]|nr:Rha family transcriptional regulator [Salmonella enterica]